MGAGLFGDFHAAQHAGNFLMAILFIQHPDAGDGMALFKLFFHLQMMVAERGDLGLVGHTQHLAVFAQFTQPLSDDVGHPPADTDIDFIKNQYRGAALL